MMKKILLASALIFSLATVQLASANASLDDNIAFRVGPFFPGIDTKVKVGNEEQNFEDYLDDSATTAAIKGVWRISQKFRLNFGYWAVNRDTSESAGQNANIAGITIPAGTSIGASFDSSLANAALGWSFIKSDTTDLGVDLGVAFLGLKSELGAGVPGVGNVSFTAFDESYVLPTVGLYLTQALTQTWSLEGRISGIGLDLGDDFKGNIVDAMGAVEYRPWQNVGFGLAYIYSHADAELKNVSNGLNVDWTYQGPFAYLVLGFGKAP